MKKYYCDVCNEWVDDMPLYGCYYYKNAICDATEKQCDATRYVRADVAERYARMRERKLISRIGIEPGTIAEILRDEVELYPVQSLRYVDGKIEAPVGHWAWKRIREILMEEAQQAAQREA